MTRLNVNVDHIATLRQARRAPEPSPVAAAVICELAGADGITVHLRGDRRHIQDRDVRLLREIVTTHLNLEMAVTSEMVKIAKEIKPDTVTLVPEDPNEITTQGGLNVVANLSGVKKAIAELNLAGIVVSTFIDPVDEQIEASFKAGAKQIEICTSRFAEFTQRTGHFKQTGEETQEELKKLTRSFFSGVELDLQIAAGHGLTFRNVPMLLRLAPFDELNIGHNIISRAVLVGLDRAVREMLEAVRRGENNPDTDGMLDDVIDDFEDLGEL